MSYQEGFLDNFGTFLWTLWRLVSFKKKKVILFLFPIQDKDDPRPFMGEQTITISRCLSFHTVVMSTIFSIISTSSHVPFWLSRQFIPWISSTISYSIRSSSRISSSVLEVVNIDICSPITTPGKESLSLSLSLSLSHTHTHTHTHISLCALLY